MDYIRELKDTEILYFLHIPKTAGTSLIKILDDQFDYSDICPEEKWDKLIIQLEKNPLNYKFLRGHLGHKINSFFSQKPIYITMLRNPVERTLSSYEHISRSIGKTLFLKIFSDKKKLEDFINDSKTRGVFVNSQVRHIGLDIDVPLLLKSSIKEKNFYFQYSDFFTNPKISDEALLETAKKHLSEFAFVGIVERFEESLMLLCYTFGWRPFSYMPKERITSNRTNADSISPELFSKIQNDTKYDLELYEYALRKFEDKFSIMVKQLKEKYLTPELEKLSFREMIFNLLEKHHAFCSKKSQNGVSLIDYDFSQSIYGDGWHERQVQSQSGIIFRWSGPGTTSRISFLLQPNDDMIIEIWIMNFLYLDILQSLILDVNNTRIELKIKSTDKQKIFVGTIPKSVFQNRSKYVELKFKIKRTASPNSKNSKFLDKRLVGLAFQKIKIFPKNTITND